MADTDLKRIAKSLDKLTALQEQICEKLGSLEERVSSIEPAAGASKSEVISFLDQFRAGEALGEASLGAWIEVSDTACLKGGLRTVQMREGFHARLLEQRIKELGGSPEAEVPQAIYDAAMEQSASADKTDAVKLQEFVARFSDIDKALAPIHEMADKLDADQETQSLLRTIAQDERSTLEFLSEACAQLNG